MLVHEHLTNRSQLWVGVMMVTGVVSAAAALALLAAAKRTTGPDAIRSTYATNNGGGET